MPFKPPARNAGSARRLTLRLSAVAALLLALAPAAQADLVQLTVSGAFHATLRQPSLTSPNVQIAEGSTVSLSFRVDTGTADSRSESQFGDFFGAVTEATMSLTSTAGQAVTVSFGVDAFQQLPQILTADNVLWGGSQKDRLAIGNGSNALAWNFTLELLAANGVGMLGSDAMPADAAAWAQVWTQATQRTLQLDHTDAVPGLGCCTFGIAGTLSGLSFVAADIVTPPPGGGGGGGGGSTGGGTGGATPVPEPRGLAWLALGLALGLRRRRA